MNRKDVINLAEWIYDLRPHLKAYDGDRELMIELAAASLMHRIRRREPRLHEETEEDFWETVKTGPAEGLQVK